MVCASLLLALLLATTSAPRPIFAHLDDCPAVIVETFGEQAEGACQIAHCETGGTFDPDATGRAGERGLFQIHPGWGVRSTYDPAANAAFAYELSRGGTRWSRDWVWCSARYGLP